MPSSEVRTRIVRSARCLVVKVGTNVLTDETGRLKARRISDLCRSVCHLIDSGREVVIVASGAVGAGIGLLELDGRPKDLAMLQATAAVGQGKLMQLFKQAFNRHDRHAAQILVTRADFEDRRRYVNISRTIEALHKVNAVPIINENDTVAVDELRFGDNDLIASLTANLVRADLMVLLSVVDGLVDNGRVVDFVPKVDADVLALAGASKSALGLGGMRSKLQAITLATDGGIDVVLAGGGRRDILEKLILNGEQVGTVFAGQGKRFDGRRSWIATAVRPAGKIVVDPGAARALIKGGKSLLASGITDVEGDFDRGAVVTVVDTDDRTLARGQVNYSSADIRRIKGQRSDRIRAILGQAPNDAIIHRNYLIVTAG